MTLGRNIQVHYPLGSAVYVWVEGAALEDLEAAVAAVLDETARLDAAVLTRALLDELDGQVWPYPPAIPTTEESAGPDVEIWPSLDRIRVVGTFDLAPISDFVEVNGRSAAAVQDGEDTVQ